MEVIYFQCKTSHAVIIKLSTCLRLSGSARLISHLSNKRDRKKDRRRRIEEEMEFENGSETRLKRL
jgi:hypothetical protein